MVGSLKRGIARRIAWQLDLFDRMLESDMKFENGGRHDI